MQDVMATNLSYTYKNIIHTQLSALSLSSTQPYSTQTLTIIIGTVPYHVPAQC